jgi:antagonist of KipI
MKATVLRAGFLTTVQDLGRMGSREFGVSLGGALDRHALRVANLLAGNDESAAGLEITLGGVRFRFEDERTISWCGAVAEVRLGAALLPAGHAAFVSAGDELFFGQPDVGCRSWLAVSGGIDVPKVLGSRSTDLRARFGGHDGRALRDDDELTLGETPRSSLDSKREKISSWSAPSDWSGPAQRRPVLRFLRGPDWSRFGEVALERFTRNTFEVAPDSDRMGVRLGGPALERRDSGDLLSEAVAPGTIQVPPNGQPILLLGDCQTIGGYPRIAHVIAVDLGKAAQLRAGDAVSFSEVSMTEAFRLLRERENEIERFRVGLSLHR